MGEGEIGFEPHIWGTTKNAIPFGLLLEPQDDVWDFEFGFIGNRL